MASGYEGARGTDGPSGSSWAADVAMAATNGRPEDDGGNSEVDRAALDEEDDDEDVEAALARL